MVAEEKIFQPGDRVVVYDYKLFVDDVSTPPSVCRKPATVVCWYGKPKEYYAINDFSLGPYESLIDVVFDHEPSFVSHGHFTTSVERIQ